MISASMPLFGLVVGFFGLSLSQVISRANLWYVFTPSSTSDDKGWMGRSDLFRILLSLILIIIVPTFIFFGIMVIIWKNESTFSIDLSYRDALKIPVAFVIPSIILGLYNIWQSIVRFKPNYFYSNSAIDKIKSSYPNAFSVGIASTALLGSLYIATSIFYFIVILALG